MAYITNIVAAQKKVKFSELITQNVDGVVFNVDSSKTYRFYVVENPNNLSADLSEDSGNIGVGNDSEFNVVVTKKIPYEATELTEGIKGEYFMCGGDSYVNHTVDPGGNWVDLYFKKSDLPGNTRCRFEVRL